MLSFFSLLWDNSLSSLYKVVESKKFCYNKCLLGESFGTKGEVCELQYVMI